MQDGDDDDGFDPAFALDDDHPGLGAGFGNELSGLGGPGGGFANELDGLDPDDHFSHDLDQAALGGLGESLAGISLGGGGSADSFARDNELDDVLATPLRRSRGAGGGSSAPSSNRLSLAFELASAGSGGGANRDLMRELGIEEGDEDAEDEAGASGSEDEVEDPRYGAEVLATPRTTTRQDPSSPSPRQRLGARASSSSLSSFHLYENGTSGNGTGFSSAHSSPANEREELDASFNETTEALESSLELTGVFLAHLRQHTTHDVDPHSPPLASSSSKPVPDPSSSRSHSATPDLVPSADFSDRQPVLESMASSVIKSMYDLSKEREQQVKELSELERLVSKNEVGWQATLAGLDPISWDDDESTVGSSGTSPRSTPAPSPAPSKPSLLASTARVELSNLRDVTSSLISALSAINEVTQVNQASVGEAGRKLRALRGHLVTAKDDLMSVERSEEFIKEYERKEKEEGGERRKGRYSELAREAMRGAQVALDEGWQRAQEVLASA
ncbi:hypothetical protein MNV49_001439 [Pseudohyphozyma bogoriensis]|nr:hypothetical protein MNV49_001439 [Pseudohyphozyma bogoriensis]